VLGANTELFQVGLGVRCKVASSMWEDPELGHPDSISKQKSVLLSFLFLFCFFGSNGA
jgi:hypothetical protein